MWMAAGVLATACATGPELRPAPAAQQVGETAAEAEVGGVRVVVDGGAWDGEPSELTQVVPVRIAVWNDSGRPLSLRFGHFALETPEGGELAAIAPLQIEGTEVTTGFGGSGVDPLVAPPGWSSFYIAPYLEPFYVGLEPWGGPWVADPFYEGGLTRWPVSLPTRSMVEQALPEGVLMGGGEVSGFVYFPALPGGVGQVTFVADLVDARTGERFGEVRIPLKRARGSGAGGSP